MSAPNSAPNPRSTSISSFSGNCSVPLNSMCSRKWATPDWSGASFDGAGVDDEPQLGPATGAIVLPDVVREPVGERADPDVGVVGDGSSIVGIDRPGRPGRRRWCRASCVATSGSAAQRSRPPRRSRRPRRARARLDAHVTPVRPATAPRLRDARLLRCRRSGRPSTTSIRADQSRSSVEPPAALIADRSAARSSASVGELGREQGRDPVAEVGGERRARAVGAHGHADRPWRAIGGKDEVTIGGLIGGVDPDAPGAGVGGDGGIDRLDPGGGDDEPHPVEVAGS